MKKIWCLLAFGIQYYSHMRRIGSINQPNVLFNQHALDMKMNTCSNVYTNKQKLDSCVHIKHHYLKK